MRARELDDILLNWGRSNILVGKWVCGGLGDMHIALLSIGSKEENAKETGMAHGGLLDE